VQIIATTKAYNIASLNRFSLAVESFLSQLSFQTFVADQLCKPIIKMPSFIRSIIMRKLISLFFLCLSIFLCSEIFSLPNLLAMNVVYGIETRVKKKNPIIKQLKDFAQNIMLADKSSSNISVNLNYIGSIQSRYNYLDTNKTASKALRVKNIQSHGNSNSLFLSNARPLRKQYNCSKRINSKAIGFSKSIQREEQNNQINTKLANLNGFSHQFVDFDFIDDEDPGIEDIFEDNNLLNAIPIPFCPRNYS